ncbi:uncharacterized protein [Lolium perenne]|uniref:uncharacterized protein n=1 Tax=Lolium perenne TaxID=4522 RepID=UPI0021EAB8D5|nr:FCS-Like Zinc finger 3-like [Lolium perenne]
MLGKRHRSMVMRRTTSVASLPPAPKQVRQEGGAGDISARAGPSSSASAVGTGAAAAWPRSDADGLVGVVTAAFLAACFFCGKALGPGKDTYIYRGEVAFCSAECRERMIEQDEMMEQNCSLTSIREAAPSAPGGSDQSGSGPGDAVAAA